MTSLFTWIDHSDAERRRMLDVVDLFREQGTRDELGISVIRDGFADLLFPGTGALQSRARYFLLIPWMFRHFESEKIRSSDIGRRARAFEGRLIEAILASGDHDRTIGQRSRSALHRMPSSIYWAGLRRLGILQFKGSQDDYYRSLDQHHAAMSRRMKTDDGEAVDTIVPTWHPGLIAAPDGYAALASPRATLPPVSLSLTRPEADYLAERIRGAVGHSLFAWFLEEMEEPADVPFAWAHPLSQELPPHLARQLNHAHCFSDVMAGASILYNGMVCEATAGREEERSEMHEMFDAWFTEIAASKLLSDWGKQRVDFWLLVSESGAKPSSGAREFVNRWIDLALPARSASDIWDSNDARALIRNREWSLKRTLARLHNEQARRTWTGFTGLGRLGFRWVDAELILNDILKAQGRV